MRIVNIPANLRIFVPDDIPDDQIKKLVENLESVSEGTVSSGLMEQELSEHVNIEPNNAMLASIIKEADLWIDSNRASQNLLIQEDS